MKTTTFQDATRHQQSLLADVERRVLLWLARHAPDAIGPDHLSLLGLCASALAGICYALCAQTPLWLHGVNLALFLNWLGDSLDGTLARHRNKLRPRYGFYVDHVIDALGLVFVLGGLALSGLASAPVAVVMMVLYLVQSINVYLATYTLGTFRLSFWKLGPTEARLLLALGNLAMLAWPKVGVAGRTVLLGDIGGVLGTAVLLALLVSSVAKTTLTLYRLERTD